MGSTDSLLEPLISLKHMPARYFTPEQSFHSPAHSLVAPSSFPRRTPIHAYSLPIAEIPADVYQHAPDTPELYTAISFFRVRMKSLIMYRGTTRAAADISRAMRHFKPYVFVEASEKRPPSIAVAARVVNQMKHFRLPKSSLAMPDQLYEIQQIVRAHFQQYEGKCPLYGNIIGSRFVYSTDESFLLDSSVNVIERQHGRFGRKVFPCPLDSDEAES
jgi:hypothetical protein